MKVLFIVDAGCVFRSEILSNDDVELALAGPLGRLGRAEDTLVRVGDVCL